MLLEVAEEAEREAKDLFREVASLVAFSGYSDTSWERFRSLKRLAMFDLWSEAAEAEKAERSGLPLDSLSAARGSELYARLRVALLEAFQTVSRPRTAEEWVEAMEDPAFRRLARIARHAIDPRVAAAAARDFADRASPKISRNTAAEGQAPVLMITQSGAELLTAALETLRRKALGERSESPREPLPPAE